MPSEDRESVVVVGGGAVGLCCALHLLRRGHRVTVVDRGVPGDGASGHNAGLFSVGNCLPTATPGVIRSVPKMLVDPYSPLAIRWTYLPRMVPWLLRFIASGRPAQVERASVAIAGLVKQALRAWEDVLPIHDSEGVVIEGGHLLGYGTDAVFAKAAFAIETRRRRGIDMRVLDEDGVADLSPILEGRFRHGVYIPRGPWANPRQLCKVLTDRMVAAGGRRVTGEVTGFVRSGDRVIAAETTSGKMEAGVVVIAAGAWSKSLTRMLGFTTPLDTERGYGVDLPDPGVELPFPIISMDYHFGMTPLPNGLRLAGTDELAGLEAPPDYRRADRLVDATKLVFPELRTHGAKRWMSYRPSHPDSLPVIGRAPRHSNVFLAYGHGHIGFTLAAITGEIIGQLVSNENPSVDPAPFHPSRFRILKGG